MDGKRTAGLAGIWGAYLASMTVTDVLQAVLLILSIIGSILYSVHLYMQIKRLKGKPHDLPPGSDS